jgi:hypothetical protein
MLCGGLALLGGLSYLYINKFKNGNKSKLIYSKEKIIQVLKDFQKEFYSINRDIRIAISVYMNRI